jgi:hypothetical protein
MEFQESILLVKIYPGQESGIIKVISKFLHHTGIYIEIGIAMKVGFLAKTKYGFHLVATSWPHRCGVDFTAAFKGNNTIHIHRL